MCKRLPWSLYVIAQVIFTAKVHLMVEPVALVGQKSPHPCATSAFRNEQQLPMGYLACSAVTQHTERMGKHNHPH